MFEDRVPAFDEMMQALIDVLKNLGRESTVLEINDNVATMLQLSPQQLAIPHKSDGSDRRTKFEYNLAWTRTYLKNAGLIANVKRGKWIITELGMGAGTLDTERIKRDIRTYTSGKAGESVTVPSPQDDIEEDIIADAEQTSTLHTEIQWLLLKLGQDMKLDVWIATNDRSRSFDGNRFDDQPKLLRRLPQRFDEATQRIVELIDVLWLKGQALVAAFEIENTSSIYSGLLRLSDLTAMQPDIDIPLYIVAPDERERKVILEINRPTFSKATNLVRRCRFISYTSLRDAVKRTEGLVAHLSPTFIDAFSKHTDKSERE